VTQLFRLTLLAPDIVSAISQRQTSARTPELTAVGSWTTHGYHSIG
jgi:hypothetical protein